MEITYFGHSCFKLKGKNGVVVMDPYDESVGWSLPKVTADVVTVSHDHGDHNAASRIKTATGGQPMVLDCAGDYETRGISFFGVESWHDDQQGALRGANIIFTVLIDGITVCHLGDLGQKKLTDDQLTRIGEVDVLLCPVGGHFTIDAKTAVEMLNDLEPKYFVPMHYQTPRHDQQSFGQVQTVDKFFNEYGISPAPVKKLTVERMRLPEETEVVYLEA